MRLTAVAGLVPLLLLANCASSRTRLAGDTCKARRAQSLIGDKATAATGARAMALSHSRSVRWVGPDMIVTLEYAMGRVTLTYGRDMRIVTIGCG